MKMKYIVALVLGFFLSVSAFAADKLAVAEPIAKGGMKAEDVEMIWSILESTVDSDEYAVISRSALKQMLTEIDLTTSSGLLNLNDTQKAKLGKIKTVKYILVSEVGKLGTRVNFTARILDCSTGEIDRRRRANLRVKDLDELADKIEPTIQKLLADDKQLNATAILVPVIRLKNAPGYLAADFNNRMEQELLRNGVKIQNLQSVAKILEANKLDNLYELEPKMFVKVGKLLEVQSLIQATINRFEIIKSEIHIVETRRTVVIYEAVLEGNIRIISAQTGLVLASIPFENSISSRELGSKARFWTEADYGKFVIKEDSYWEKAVFPQLKRGLSAE